jgi:tetratricopeptide (TPR) repeat protein
LDFRHFFPWFHPKTIPFVSGEPQHIRMRVFLSILILSAGTASAADFDGLIKQGRASLLAFDLDAAQAALAEACPADRMAALPLEQTAVCEHEWGAVADARGNDEEARGRYLKALEGWEELGSPYLGHEVATMANLGALYRRQHRLSEAEATLSQALELTKTLTGPGRELHAMLLSRSGALYGDLDQPDRARSMLEEAITDLRAPTPHSARELALAYNSLGMIEVGAGRYKSAEFDLREAMNLAGETLGEASPETAAYATNLALALLAEGEYSRAGTLLRRARFVIESRLGPGSFQVVNALVELTSAETGLGRFRIAEDSGDKALSILNRLMPPGSPEIALTQVIMGNLYLREGRTAEAEKILPAAVDAERRSIRDERTLAAGIRALAALRVQQQAWNDAESLYREVIGHYERKLGAGHPDLAPVLREYAAVLRHRGGSKAEIRSVEARARDRQFTGIMIQPTTWSKPGQLQFKIRFSREVI